jgi:hypothetical protein
MEAGMRSVWAFGLLLVACTSASAAEETVKCTIREVSRGSDGITTLRLKAESTCSVESIYLSNPLPANCVANKSVTATGKRVEEDFYFIPVDVLQDARDVVCD